MLFWCPIYSPTQRWDAGVPALHVWIRPCCVGFGVILYLKFQLLQLLNWIPNCSSLWPGPGSKPHFKSFLLIVEDAFERWVEMVTSMAAFFGWHFLFLIFCPADGGARDFLELVCALTDTQHLILFSIHSNYCIWMVAQSLLLNQEIWRHSNTPHYNSLVKILLHPMIISSNLVHLVLLGTLSSSKCVVRELLAFACYGSCCFELN